jgi:predicted aminopeptidase
VPIPIWTTQTGTHAAFCRGQSPASNYAGDFENRKMINTKQNCALSLRGSLRRAANWRRSMQAKYPEDDRNGLAAETLDRIASDTASLSDDSWAKLQNYYSWCSEPWNEAVAKASRLVGFRNVDSLPAYTSALEGILSGQY